jgi:hypothetical protein
MNAGIPKKKVPAVPAAAPRDSRPLDEDSSAAHPREVVGSRDRRPSDKVAAQRMFFLLDPLNCFKCSFPVEAQREMEREKADKEERRKLRKKKKSQKDKQDAGIATDSEDEFQERENATVFLLLVLNIYY